MKLEEIRKSYEDLSRTFSNTVRNLAISGIAIAWLFMTKEDTGTMMFVLMAAMFFFIITLFADLIQNYQLSITWYNYYTLMKDKHGREESEDVKEPENKNKLGWRLYKSKLWTLVIGYILIVIFFICFVTGNNVTWNHGDRDSEHSKCDTQSPRKLTRWSYDITICDDIKNHGLLLLIIPK